MKRLLLILSLIVLLVLGFLLGNRLFPESFLGQLWSSSHSAVVTQVELKRLSLLNTAEYRMRLIFPYDFVDSQPDWLMYKNFWEFHRSTFYSRIDPAEYVDGQLPGEWAAGPFYARCREAGIDPYLFKDDFLVLPVWAKAGVDLSSMNDTLAGEPLAALLEEEGETLLRIHLPKADITDLVIEDQDSREWGYPDARISPEDLKYLITYLLPDIEERVRKSGLLEQADRQARMILESLFAGSGYSRIEYIR